MNEYGGTKHTGVPVKTLKKLLKKAGLKTSGKKTALTRRAKKAKLLKGSGFFDMFRKKQEQEPEPEPINPTFKVSNPMYKHKQWEGSPPQIAARAERLKSPTRAASIFIELQGLNGPDYFPGLAESYLKKHGSNLLDQDPDLAKDYIQHYWVNDSPKQPAKTPKQPKWEGSPEQIAARTERLKDPNIAGTADHFFEQGKRNPKYLNDDDDGVNPIKKYLELYGTNLYDQKDDLVKDYIHHFYMHVAVSR